MHSYIKSISATLHKQRTHVTVTYAVDHDLLAQRLERQYGLRGVVLQWFNGRRLWQNCRDFAVS